LPPVARLSSRCAGSAPVSPGTGDASQFVATNSSSWNTTPGTDETARKATTENVGMPSTRTSARNRVLSSARLTLGSAKLAEVAPAISE
jgi:hypothetical protein